MIPQTCLLIETKKFPILDGEDEEIVNDRTYGKALCEYLESTLPDAGVDVPFFCCEDWGWWLEVAHNGFKMALCIYSDPDAVGHPEKYVLTPSIRNEKKWSWSRFRKIDVSRDVVDIVKIVQKVFENDKEIATVSCHDHYPL